MLVTGVGEELETTRQLNPASDAVRRVEQNGKPPAPIPDQTWQVCVTAFRAIPPGARGEEYEIPGSERCSDPFRIPKAS
jgi:hypothetical protein